VSGKTYVTTKLQNPKLAPTSKPSFIALLFESDDAA
jgi:hypothetical protein